MNGHISLPLGNNVLCFHRLSQSLRACIAFAPSRTELEANDRSHKPSDLPCTRTISALQHTRVDFSFEMSSISTSTLRFMSVARRRQLQESNHTLRCSASVTPGAIACYQDSLDLSLSCRAYQCMWRINSVKFVEGKVRSVADRTGRPCGFGQQTCDALAPTYYNDYIAN